MKLTYRGVSYEYNPPLIETSEVEVVGKYRGLDWRFRNPTKVPVMQSNLDLKYRGVAYSTNDRTEQVSSTPTEVKNGELVQTPVFSIQDRARSLMLKHSQTIKNRQQVMLNRLAAEIGLTDDVSQYSNCIQGKIHPTFRATYDRGLASAS